MNDEFEHRLSRHALRPVPPGVVEELVGVIRAQSSAPAPRSPRIARHTDSAVPVWQTLGLLWAGAVAMLCLSHSGEESTVGSPIRPTPEQVAALRAERIALWELATVREDAIETPAFAVPPQAPTSSEPEERSRIPHPRPQRPHSRRSSPSLPTLGHGHPALVPFTNTPCSPHPHALPA